VAYLLEKSVGCFKAVCEYPEGEDVNIALLTSALVVAAARLTLTYAHEDDVPEGMGNMVGLMRMEVLNYARLKELEEAVAEQKEDPMVH
jgi:hypothetical protein